MYLFGASGHGKVIVEMATINDLEIECFIDADSSKKEFLGFDVIQNLPSTSVNYVISIGNNRVRKKIAEVCTHHNAISIVHPNAIISNSVSIGKGSVIMAGVVINAASRIEEHCIINTNASVDHDCIIGSFAHISPGVALAGNVCIGEGTHIGIGACIIQGIKIGKWCTIGAGTVIIEDVPDGATVVGNPGRIIKFADKI